MGFCSSVAAITSTPALNELLMEHRDDYVRGVRIKI